jgi:hypothetical protein
VTLTANPYSSPHFLKGGRGDYKASQNGKTFGNYYKGTSQSQYKIILRLDFGKGGGKGTNTKSQSKN